MTPRCILIIDGAREVWFRWTKWCKTLKQLNCFNGSGDHLRTPYFNKKMHLIRKTLERMKHGLNDSDW